MNAWKQEAEAYIYAPENGSENLARIWPHNAGWIIEAMGAHRIYCYTHTLDEAKKKSEDIVARKTVCSCCGK